MTTTGQLGTLVSQLGQIVLGTGQTSENTLPPKIITTGQLGTILSRLGNLTLGTISTLPPQGVTRWQWVEGGNDYTRTKPGRFPVIQAGYGRTKRDEGES